MKSNMVIVNLKGDLYSSVIKNGVCSDCLYKFISDYQVASNELVFVNYDEADHTSNQIARYTIRDDLGIHDKSITEVIDDNEFECCVESCYLDLLKHHVSTYHLYIYYLLKYVMRRIENAFEKVI